MAWHGSWVCDFGLAVSGRYVRCAAGTRCGLQSEGYASAPVKKHKGQLADQVSAVAQTGAKKPATLDELEVALQLQGEGQSWLVTAHQAWPGVGSLSTASAAGASPPHPPPGLAHPTRHPSWRQAAEPASCRWAWAASVTACSTYLQPTRRQTQLPSSSPCMVLAATPRVRASTNPAPRRVHAQSGKLPCTSAFSCPCLSAPPRMRACKQAA